MASASTSKLRQRMLTGLAGRQLLAGAPRLQQPLRCISSHAEALSYHPSSHASSSAPSSSSKSALAREGGGESATAKAERTLKRFWKTVSLVQDPNDSSWTIHLDKRTLKTPDLKPIRLPKEKKSAAIVIAHEWDSQEQILKPHSLPLTSLASRALDGLSDPTIQPQVVQELTRYLHTDTVCYAEEGKSNALTRLQEEHWTPLIKWAEKHFDTPINIAAGQLFNQQSQETVQKLSSIVAAYDPWRLAGFERSVMASKSYIIGLGLAEGFLTAEQAALAAHVEVQSQIERWGEVEDTHDVDHQDIRVRLGSSALIMSDLPVHSK